MFRFTLPTYIELPCLFSLEYKNIVITEETFMLVDLSGLMTLWALDEMIPSSIPGRTKLENEVF